VLVFHHTPDFRVLYLACLSSDSAPQITRVEADPDTFTLISRKKRHFEALVRSNCLRLSKLDPNNIPSESSGDMKNEDRELSEQPSSRYYFVISL
jgi:hypothetical protein